MHSNRLFQITLPDPVISFIGRFLQYLDYLCRINEMPLYSLFGSRKGDCGSEKSKVFYLTTSGEPSCSKKKQAGSDKKETSKDGASTSSFMTSVRDTLGKIHEFFTTWNILFCIIHCTIYLDCTIYSVVHKNVNTSNQNEWTLTFRNLSIFLKS